MFRKMRRLKQQLSEDACLEILKKEPRGVLSMMGDDGYPYGIVMNQFYDEKNNKIYFHCAKEGKKIDALRQNNKVSFCVYDQGFRKEGEWPLNIQSVLIFGRIRFIEDKEIALEKVRLLGLKHYPDAASVEKVLEKAIDRVQLLELTIDHMSGKLVNES